MQGSGGRDGAKEGIGLSPRAARSVSRVPARRHQSPGLPGTRTEICGGRCHCPDIARGPSAELRVGSAGAERRCADQDELRDGAVAAGQRQHQRLLREAGKRRRQAAGRARHSRKPRPESLHRRRGASLRPGELHRVRARWFDIGRRLSGHRRRRRRQVSAGERTEDVRRLRRVRNVAEGAARLHGKDRRDRLLLRRRHRQQPRRAVGE